MGEIDQQKYPVIFFGHGNPMNAIEENEFVSGFRKIAAEIPKPRVILCISAHWETNGSKLTGMEWPVTIHDFGGFPRELYQVQYPAPGNPLLVSEMIEKPELNKLLVDQEWGLDHGTWTVLRHCYPKADVPIVQLSLNRNMTPEMHYNLGKEIAYLREKGILIVGSGNIVHNLREVAWHKLHQDDFGFDWAREANQKVKELILHKDDKSLINYKQLGVALQNAVPTPEHYLPLLYILGCRNETDKVKVFNDKMVGGSLSMTSYLFE